MVDNARDCVTKEIVEAEDLKLLAVWLPVHRL